MSPEARRWAQTFMRQLTPGPLPLFGSPEWEQAHGPVRMASAVRAALAWLEEGDSHRIAARLDLELEAARQADDDDYQCWRQVAGKVRAVAGQPTHAELKRRRSA